MQGGSLEPLRKVKVYGSRDSLFLVGLNKKQEAYEVTEVARSREVQVKRNFQIHRKASYRNFVGKNGLEYVCKCEGILGCIRFLNYPYLYVITKKERVAVLLNEHKVYLVKSVLLIPFRDDVFGNFNDENELVQLFYNSVNHKHIYFSYTYNLPCSVQVNFYLQKEFLRGGIIHSRDYANEYLWNGYHCKAFVRQNVFICVPTISGFYVQSKFLCEGKAIDVTFIARRCNKYAGTRYRKRGINAKGYAANQVETELILFQRNYETAILSYVQLRGSVPVFWTQGVNYHLLKRPKIKCKKYDAFFTCTKRHFRHLLARYGYPIIAINLLSKKKQSDESNLSNEYEACIGVINRDLPPPIRIIYRHLDLRKAYKIGTKYTLQKLKIIFNFSQRNVGYFYLRNGQVVVIQRGVLRFNCVDCLDRTNAAQLFLKMYMLVHFLKLIFRVKMKALCVNHVAHLSQMYEELGDAIAKQYAGSTAHKKYTPGQSNNFFVQSKELLTSIKRYYISSFNDLEKQKSINLFLGVAQDKLQDIRHAHDLDAYVHGRSFFRLAGAGPFWWVLPLERFCARAESLLGGGLSRAQAKRRADRRAEGRTARRNARRTSHLTASRSARRGDSVAPSRLRNLKFYRCFSATNVFRNLYNAHDWEGRFAQLAGGAGGAAGLAEEVASGLAAGGAAGLAVGGAAGVAPGLAALLLKSCGGASHAGRPPNQAAAAVLPPFERSLNLIAHIYRFYDAHRQDFRFFFKNKNIFRFRVWRFIATYNYLNYLRVFFDVFFLLYYCFCERYSVRMVYMSHVNALCAALGGSGQVERGGRTVGQGNHTVQRRAAPLVNPYTVEKDVQKITHQYMSHKKMSFALEPYLNYYNLNRAPYQYMLMSGRSLVGRRGKNGKRPTLRVRHPCGSDAEAKRFKRVCIPHVGDSPVVDDEGKTHCRPIFKKKLIEQIKNRVVQGTGACPYYSRAYERSKRRCREGPARGEKQMEKPYQSDRPERLQLERLEDQIGKSPRGYCPIYFNANMVKFFFFLYSSWRGGGAAGEDAEGPASMPIVRGIVMGVLRAALGLPPSSGVPPLTGVSPPTGLPPPSVGPNNMQLLLRQATQARSLQEGLSDLYMHCVYKSHEYKELPLGSLQNPNAPTCSDEKSKMKRSESEQRFLLDEYDTLEHNLKKKKKKIWLVDRKIKNEVQRNHAHLSREYLSLKHYTKTYFNQMIDLQKRDGEVKRLFLRQIGLGNSQTANQTYHFLEESSCRFTRIDAKKKKKSQFAAWTSEQLAPDFNVLRHRLEGKVDYRQYCNPLSREIFRP
ncbi:phosphoinositide phosphatase SAC1, putative [Plasmodium vivax]|uniref:Phosphoinositide phosphatase SAC1, putative n=1 Tax=Plasmodium vivax (strain Salvador I) TaxID=126793 RepID=A5KCJ0_PLAVS|nr:phosphoinositide phosphatase SAC1, putative [Plasmodium vivax]EDL42931.1 phosphoinositide phosphatase SAC1, putative [Plasmodium vivax]|eukprot:XP_001608593.1 phosphoinositide phosphatase SAC1 [Plasmodium vivax Sal-1]